MHELNSDTKGTSHFGEAFLKLLKTLIYDRILWASNPERPISLFHQKLTSFTRSRNNVSLAPLVKKQEDLLEHYKARVASYFDIVKKNFLSNVLDSHDIEMAGAEQEGQASEDERMKGLMKLAARKDTSVALVSSEYNVLMAALGISVLKKVRDLVSSTPNYSIN